MTSQDEILKHPSLLLTIPNLNGNNAGEFFRVLEETAVLGQWSKPQLIAIGKLKLEGRARYFYDVSLAGQKLDYKTWKEKFIKQFEDGQSFATNFSRFSSAFQMESERVRDFASRIEGLAHKSFNGSDVGASGMSEELREKILLSQFTVGLKPTVRTQILIENPGKFQEAVEVADRIEKAQNMLTPNINVVSSLTGSETNFETLMKANTETYTKTIDLLSKYLEKMNERLDRLENEKERKESSSRNFKSPNFVKQ
ncbi:hypothetical protein AVEN_134808-1 [Araneus ventricosus]|uniref:Retrotransposon gag domain-containing protein n=1 Tax=Araneus ventricosus TaxID=182803 RepID=A0A4Y2GBT8_ARAVE|nr:hypothetical protein AVEN_134808-1 [Araneus ventricosus]